MAQTGITPGLYALLARDAGHQLMPELQRGFRSLAFITGADRRALFVVHQWKIKRRRHHSLGKFNRGAHVQQGRISGEDRAIIHASVHGTSFCTSKGDVLRQIAVFYAFICAVQ